MPAVRCDAPSSVLAECRYAHSYGPWQRGAARRVFPHRTVPHRTADSTTSQTELHEHSSARGNSIGWSGNGPVAHPQAGAASPRVLFAPAVPRTTLLSTASGLFLAYVEVGAVDKGRLLWEAWLSGAGDTGGATCCNTGLLLLLPPIPPFTFPAPAPPPTLGASFCHGIRRHTYAKHPVTQFQVVPCC